MGSQWIASLRHLKNVSYIAAPLVAVTLLQYLLQVVSLVMVGRLDELSLSGVSLATSFTAVTGVSVLTGMAGALETLCGQAYGAEKYQKLGTYTYSAIISLVLVSVPISILWLFTDKLLILMRQDPSISQVAHKFSIFLIPNLFSHAILQSLIRFFQTQGLILPMLLSSGVALCFHILLCWILVFKLELKFVGAALSMSLSSWLNVILLGLYFKYSTKCENTRAPLSRDVFLSMKVFFRLAVPSAGMVCLGWWSYEVIIVLSGMLPEPKLETSVLSICFTITYLHFYISYAFGAAASTRVSNELGAGNPQAAKMAVCAIMALTVLEVLIVSITVFLCRRILGYALSNSEEIVHQVAEMGPFLSLCIIVDGLQAVLSGIARGSGWQRIGASVNLGAYYLLGIPVAAVLAFVIHLKVKGLLIGLATGSFMQAVLLGLVTVSTNWQKQALKARERILEGDHFTA